MIFKDEEMLTEAYANMLEEAKSCAAAKKGCKCDKCGSCQHNQEKKNVKEALDPVGKEDSDVNNDEKEDETDEYLLKRRQAIAKAKGEEEKKETNESFLKKELTFKDLYDAVMSNK